MATVDTSRVDAVESAPVADGRRLERWYSWVDTLLYVATLNFLILAFTLAGAVVLGWAPALAAAASCSRDRVRDRSFSTVRTFARAWRSGFVNVNLLAAPVGVTLALLGTSYLALRGGEGTGLLVAGLWTAAAVCVAHLLLTLTMDAHYDLRRRDCLRLAWAFMVRFPGAPLLLLATTALVAVVSGFVPGLLPVVSIGAWIHLCTALCLSFFAANDKNVAGPSSSTASISE